MKILLLGEYSGVHKNLKEGLLKIGIKDVCVASNGDGFKSIFGDIDLRIAGNNIFVKGYNLIKRNISLLKLVEKYDIVQLMNPFIFYKNYLPNYIFFYNLLKKSKKFYMLAAGDDSFFWRVGRYRLDYGPFDDFLKYDLGAKKKYFMESDRAYYINKFVADNCDGIIPIMYEYEISYKGHKNLKKVIPIPINVDKIKYDENIVKDKIVVFHGLNRFGFKGTRHVEKAFEILKKKYPKKLDLIIDGKMPLNEYLNLMKKAHIIIDQTNSYSLGVNGIYAMALGKVVLGGAEPESLNSIGVNSSPVVNIKPNAESIVEEIEKLIDDKEKIRCIGYESRKFAEEIHGYTKVAKKYLDAWGVIT